MKRTRNKKQRTRTKKSWMKKSKKRKMCKKRKTRQTIKARKKKTRGQTKRSRSSFSLPLLPQYPMRESTGNPAPWDSRDHRLRDPRGREDERSETGWSRVSAYRKRSDDQTMGRTMGRTMERKTKTPWI